MKRTAGGKDKGNTRCHRYRVATKSRDGVWSDRAFAETRRGGRSVGADTKEGVGRYEGRVSVGGEPRSVLRLRPRTRERTEGPSGTRSERDLTEKGIRVRGDGVGPSGSSSSVEDPFGGDEEVGLHEDTTLKKYLSVDLLWVRGVPFLDPEWRHKGPGWMGWGRRGDGGVYHLEHLLPTTNPTPSSNLSPPHTPPRSWSL